MRWRDPSEVVHGRRNSYERVHWPTRPRTHTHTPVAALPCPVAEADGDEPIATALIPYLPEAPVTSVALSELAHPRESQRNGLA